MVASPSAPAMDGSVGMSFGESGVAVSEVKADEPEVADLIKELCIVEVTDVSTEEPLSVVPMEAPSAVVDEDEIDPTVDVEERTLLVCGVLIVAGACWP